MKPKAIVVDDHHIFRKGLISLLSNEDIADVIDEASNGMEFLAKIETMGVPDIVLMDIDMPIMGGEETVKKAIEKYPNMKILILSMFGDEGHYFAMVNAGVKGFVLKNADIVELEEAIRCVARGETYFSNELLRKIISKITPQKEIERNKNINITEREIEVLKFICSGLTNEEIAEKLNISPTTVKGHRTHLLEKTNCKNTASLIIFSIKNKIIKL